MLYNSTKTSTGTVMPLLMGCTMQSRIQECLNDQPSYYDPVTQRTYDARVVGTYSLRTEMTKSKNCRFHNFICLLTVSNCITL